MQVIRRLVFIATLAVCSRDAVAQARPQVTAVGPRDTLPERVARRTFEAFKRHDVEATYANFDSIFVYERFGDPAGARQLRRDETVRKMKADSAVMRIVNGQHVVLVRSDVYGAFVNQEWRTKFADGREFKHFELFEVRGGKIVRELEGDHLMNVAR